jgi:hypothetical protein
MANLALYLSLRPGRSGPNLNRCMATVQRTRQLGAVERPEVLAWQPMPGSRWAEEGNALVSEVEPLAAA